MSRVAKKPVVCPAEAEIKVNGSKIEIKGPKGVACLEAHADVVIGKGEGGQLLLAPKDGVVGANALAGTTRALIGNMIIGVTSGFERKLLLVGVGFKAQAQGKILNLSLGFSHPVQFKVPDGITIETPAQTEVVIKGVDKQLVGQVAAKIRAVRPPEPYKGKGVRYEGEVIVLKEGKKK